MKILTMRYISSFKMGKLAKLTIIKIIIIATIVITGTAIKETKITVIPDIREIIITPDIISKRIIILKLIISQIKIRFLDKKTNRYNLLYKIL